MLRLTSEGLYCPAGGFHIDPWMPVARAVITHTHADHACPGSEAYLTSSSGERLLRARVGPDAAIETADYGRSLDFNGTRVSLHPAGHILGSAQVRIERAGQVWVVSGDYKLEADPTCLPFEPVRCHTFVTESTFGLPIYRWQPEAQVLDEIAAWWRANRDAGKASVLFGYALGKAQRILARIDAAIGPIYAHGAVEMVNRIYRESGVALAATNLVREAPANMDWSRALIVAPPSWTGNPWMRRFGPASTALCSGWMRIRGTRRRRSLDRGFVLSDHADWPGLLTAIRESGAQAVWVTHGYRAPLARWLEEHGLQAHAVETRFDGERDEVADEEVEES